MTAITGHDTKDPKGFLKEFFGFDTFKGNQEVVIQSIMDGKDCFVIMPTGAGKSMCYQLPAIMMEGTAIVISPLIALMKNQVDNLRGFSSSSGLAHFLNSSLNKADFNQVIEDVISGETKLLYVAPETLKKQETLDLLAKVKVSFVAVDEAHCISEWGHDFRPEYRKIKQMVRNIGNIPILALTATATPKVQHDIQKNLNMLDANLFKSSFNRPNLYYKVRPKGRKDVVHKEIITFIQQHQDSSGIVYCLSRKKVEEIAQMLERNGIKALPYHAGLDSKIRAQHQDAFLMEKCDVIVATIAFGMGIDKPDVRYVIHYDVPKSLEGYYQETGRAGRDGMRGDCLLFYNPNDIEKLEKFMKDKPVAEQEIGRLLIAETEAFAESSQCRRKLLLHYFGEEFSEDDCEKMCDNCAYPKPKENVERATLMALEMVAEIKGEFTLTHLVNVIIGNTAEAQIKHYGHHLMSHFGKGKERDKIFWKSVFRLALVEGFLHKNIERYGLLSLTPRGEAYLLEPYELFMPVDTEFDHVSDEDFDSFKLESLSDKNLFKGLKDLRRKVAQEMELPPYVIFQDPSLEDMATKYPITIEELANINGVGKNKAQKFGAPFIAFIEKYVKDNEIDRPMEVVLKGNSERSAKRVNIILNIDKKVDLPDIADQLKIEFDEMLEELTQIVNSGTKINIRYFLNQFLDEDLQEEIVDYFRNEEVEDIDAAVDYFDGEFTYEELKLMHLQFMSDVAN